MGRTKKFRGSRTHGHGKKARRGAGKRGGRGMAGGHKHRYMYIIKYMPDHFGRRGFGRHPSLRKVHRTINVGDLARYLKKWEELGVIKKEKMEYVIDLGELGYDKLLGAGKIDLPVRVRVENASSIAVKKVADAGGSVELPEEGN
ncbi:MAG: 50S ribosomal protein L15 [Thermoplasmata archaeon]|nr:MAG: 50S ribosomal protein L15 [Thermoplasmata archaeon]